MNDKAKIWKILKFPGNIISIFGIKILIRLIHGELVNIKKSTSNTVQNQAGENWKNDQTVHSERNTSGHELCKNILHLALIRKVCVRIALRCHFSGYTQHFNNIFI